MNQNELKKLLWMHRTNMSTWVFDLKIVYTEIETDHGQHHNQTNERYGICLWMVRNEATGFLADW